MSNETKKSNDIPTTKKMLEETRDELKASIASVKLDVSAVREEMKSEFSSVRSDINEVRSEIKELSAAVHRALALHEDQNSRNRYVLDGHQSLHDRQDKYESETNERIDRIESVISKINTTN